MKYLFYSLILFFSVACVTVEAINENGERVKDLNVSFFNDTPFTIDILEDNPESLSPILRIESKKTKKFTKTLYVEDEITAFFYVKFQIPVNKQLIPVIDYRDYRIETKNGLSQNVSISVEGALTKQAPYYIVLKNTSNKGIEVCNSSSKSLYFSLDKTKSVSPKKSIVYSSKDRPFYTSHDKVSMLILCNGAELPFFISSLQSGYVYTFEFNGKEAVKVDERPILKVGEPLWRTEDASIAIEKMLKVDNLYYAIGKKETVDQYKNSYYCPYISCIDSSGNLQWKNEESSIDGEIIDAVSLEDGSILTCGQSVVAGENVGSLWLYSSDGTLLDSKNYTHLQELINLVVVDGGVVISGFDNEGEFTLSKIAIVKNAIASDKKITALLPNTIAESKYAISSVYDATSNTLYLFCNLANDDGEVLPSKLFAIKENGKTEEINLNDKIASISCAVKSATGEIYVGGESTIDEKTEAVILKIEKDKSAKVFYQGSIPFSYIASMYLDEASKTLVAGGVCKAKESSGVGGVPFIASFDTASGKELWRREYKSIGKQLLRSFVPCSDYGFITSFSSVIQMEDDIFYAASLLARMNATGEVK